MQPSVQTAFACCAAVHLSRCLQVVAEAIRLLLLAINHASSHSHSEAEHALLALLLNLLINDIAPKLASAPALADIATKLVTHIASGPAAAAVKAVVAGLPTQDKLKLQVRLICCRHTVLLYASCKVATYSMDPTFHCQGVALKHTQMCLLVLGQITKKDCQEFVEMQAAMQAVTQPVSRPGQSATTTQLKPKAATITLKNFAAFGKS